MISTHALREEGDMVRCTLRETVFNFYPRPPRGGRRTMPPGTSTLLTYFYPRPPRGGRLLHRHSTWHAKSISTHALREEGDGFSKAFGQIVQTFLPTPSARRATVVSYLRNACRGDFYPRPPRGGRLYNESWVMVYDIFLPTPSARRATSAAAQTAQTAQISTHALREEGDGTIWRTPPSTSNFYPRPPRGGRPASTTIRFTLSAISTHALREEGDGAGHCQIGLGRNFYPRPPRGGRPEAIRKNFNVSVISTHALREEGDRAFRPAT